jgi:hypothetical protein
MAARKKAGRKAGWWLAAAGVCLGVACVEGPQDVQDPSAAEATLTGETSQVEVRDAAKDEATTPGEARDQGVGERKELPPKKAVEAPKESPRLERDATGVMEQRLGVWFANHPTSQTYIQTDKPLYKPGETIWVRAWNVKKRERAVGSSNQALYELISPKGAVVKQQYVQEQGGTSLSQFDLPPDVPGGEYKLRVTDNNWRVTEEKPIIVSVYEAPRLKKKLEFVRKAYGPGDEVEATLEVKRPTGEALAHKPLKATIRLDGVDLQPVGAQTNAHGGAVVRFKLPAQISLGDGLLTVLVDDGGVTESVSKRVPIVLKKVQFEMFPEGGELVEGLPGRVYFEAKTPLGKPADVKGEVVDDKGEVVGQFESVRDGMGRFAFTPRLGRKYKARITAPEGVEDTFALEGIKREGCALNTYDDYDGQEDAVRVAVRCTQAREVFVSAVQQEQTLDLAAVKVPKNATAVVHLKPKDGSLLRRAQGVARVTLWDADKRPLAERLVFRNRRSGLQVELVPDKPSYGPRDQVALKVVTKDADGKPVSAHVALSVVDDTVISYADDKTGHMTSRLLLEQELQGELEDPKFYFDLTEEKSAQGLDLLMGTRGWRRFEWKPVMAPPPEPKPEPPVRAWRGGGGQGRGMRWDMVPQAPPQADLAMPMGGALADPNLGDGLEAAQGLRANQAAPGQPAEVVVAADAGPRRAPRPEPAPKADKAPQREEPKKKEKVFQFDDVLVEGRLLKPDAAVLDEKRQVDAERAQKLEPAPAQAGEWADDGLVARDRRGGEADKPRAMEMEKDLDWLGPDQAQPAAAWEWARVFPIPQLPPAPEGPRTDFRDTIFWGSAITQADGTATVVFPMSDAVTSFRVYAEGVGGGRVGRKEEVVKSSLPFSMAVKLPVEVSAGDKLKLPLTLTNDRDVPLTVTVEASFGDQITFRGDPKLQIELPAGSRKSALFPVEVTGQAGASEVHLSASAGDLKDEFVRTLQVVPPGFPQLVSASGQLNGKHEMEVSLDGAIPGSVKATVQFYPAPVATILSGLDGLLREPNGCFEQTSSTNYPNIMVMQYLKEHQQEEPALLQKSGALLDRGYQLLAGYESPNKGYEWFGGDPGHEALTAYGLMEFRDMQGVWGGVDGGMVERTARWLKTRRDGKGGFLRNDRALDSFGQASPEVTDAYITWALVEGGFAGEFKPEVEAQAKRAENTQDPYLLGLACNTLLTAPGFKDQGKALAARLAKMQGKEGGWSGANHSITRSGGESLEIETTSLALLALMKDGGYDPQVRAGIEWLNNHRGGFGQWGATQSTILSLKAMTRYASLSRKTRNAGSVTVLVNGKLWKEIAYAEGHQDALVVDGWEEVLQPGKNKVEIIHEAQEAMPFSAAVEYRSSTPASSPQATIDLETRLERPTASMGESVRLTATVTNKTDAGQPMTLARVGLPGGLSFQTWQLKELREQGLIAFYETRPREVILYLRDMKPSEVKTIPLDLLATVPGTYLAPSSSAYLYYTNEHKTWRDGLAVQIEP